MSHPTQLMTPVMRDVRTERRLQDAKWGVQQHTDMEWLTILTEEVGEAAKSALRDRFDGNTAGAFRHELVQVAAVSIAAIECIDARTEAATEDKPQEEAREIAQSWIDKFHEVLAAQPEIPEEFYRLLYEAFRWVAYGEWSGTPDQLLKIKIVLDPILDDLKTAIAGRERSRIMKHLRGRLEDSNLPNEDQQTGYLIALYELERLLT